MKHMTGSLMLGLVGLAIAAPLSAQEPGQRQREHVVREGDTLWDLAGHYFSNPFTWTRIYEANRTTVEDPHWIYPEEVLIIPGLYDDAADPVVAVRPMDRPTRTVFYREPTSAQTGATATVIEESSEMALPVKTGQFQSAEFLANPRDLLVYGEMVRPLRSSEMSPRMSTPTAHPNERVFFGYRSDQRPAVGDRLLVVRPGDRVRDAGRNVRMIIPTAVVEVLALSGQVIDARIERQFEVVEFEDLLIPMPFFPDFMAPEAIPLETSDNQGEILRFVMEQPLYARTDRGFINRGSQHGVKVGDVFIAYLPERQARPAQPGDRRGGIERLPPETVAELLIVKTTPTTATFMVSQLLLPELAPGVWVRRIRAMP